MYKLKYRVKTKSQIIITNNLGGSNQVSSLKYLPGAQLLGVFAKAYIKKEKSHTEPHFDENFQRWFSLGHLKFLNAYPIQNLSPSRSSYSKMVMFYPSPLSIKTKKDETEEVVDLINFQDPIDFQAEKITRFVHTNSKRILLYSPLTETNFHFKRNYSEDGMPEDNDIFYYECIAEGEEFEGEILGSQADLQKFISKIQGTMHCRIGKAKFAQYGEAEISFLSNTEEELPLPSIDNGQTRFNITFRSDAIFYDKLGIATVDLSTIKSNIANAINTSEGDFTITKQYINAKYVESFSSVWKLKKPNELALLVGSVLQIKFKDGVDNSAIKNLEIQSIGQRTGEGFGRVSITAQPIGITRFNREVKKKDKMQKPSKMLSGQAKLIVQGMLSSYLKEQASENALRDANTFLTEDFTISNSLLTRLEMKVSQEPQNFIRFIEKERKRIVHLLENTKGEKKTLFEKLTKTQIDKFSDLCNTEPIMKTCEKIEYNFAEVELDLYTVYWVKFFRYLRKMRKIE